MAVRTVTSGSLLCHPVQVSGLISYDVDGLMSLSRTLSRVADGLAAARSELRGADDVLGDREVVEGLEHFEEHWRDGREKVVDGARRISDMIGSSVRLYSELDEQGAGQVHELW
jgi:hypothetical protein